VQAATAARHPGLEDALLHAGDDRAANLVYADWLQSHGNPLGELIATQIAAEDEPARARKVKMRARKLLDEYIQAHLVPEYPLLEQRLLAYQLGPNEKGRDGIGSSKSSSVIWRRGFIESMETWCWTDEMRAEGLRLLGDPHARLLRELCLRDERVDDLGFVAHLEALRVLNLRWAATANLTSLVPLSGLGQLDRLNLRGSARLEDIGPLAGLPLVKLTLEGTVVRDLTPLAGSATLEHVDLAGAPVEDATPLLTCPRLCYVGLWDTRVPAEQADALRRHVEANDAEPTYNYDKYVSHREI